MVDPSFLLIIGAPKCGTSSLAAALAAHSSVRIGLHKEPRFFTDFSAIDWRGPGSASFRTSIVADEKDYLASFEGEGEVRWNIDASTDYLWCPASPDLIERWSRRFRTKVICITRDPIARIVSEYQHTIRDNLQNKTLMNSLKLENKRILMKYQPLFYHVKRSLYIEKLKIYRDIFSENMLIIDFHALFTDYTMSDKLKNFLELPTLQFGDRAPENVSYVYKSPFIEYVSKLELTRRLAKKVIGENLRLKIRRQLESVNRVAYAPSNDEMSYMGEALAEEIRLCGESDLVDVGGWLMGNRFTSAAARGK